jgi:hypothetical protein
MPTPANGTGKSFDFEAVLVILRILRQQDDIRNIPVLSRRVPGRFPCVEEADIQAILDSQSAHLTEKNRERLTLLREPED